MANQELINKLKSEQKANEEAIKLCNAYLEGYNLAKLKDEKESQNFIDNMIKSITRKDD